MSFISELKQGIKNHRDTVFPGTERRIRIRVLTCAEVQVCATEAEKWMTEHHGLKYGEFNANLFSEEYDIRLLFTAITDMDDNPIADDVHQLRASLNESERHTLAHEYNDVQNEFSPAVDTMNDAEFSQLVDRIKKKPELAGNIFSLSLLRKLITTMASPPSSSPTDSGS